VPLDLSFRVVAAFVPDGQGGYNKIVGTGTQQGTFTIPGVPKGYYLLRLAGQYLWTRNTVVNADYWQAYRSTAAAPENPTSLTFDLANLNAWQDTDFFEIVDPNSGAFQLFPGVAGETSFTGTYDYVTNLNDYTQGDKTYFLQLITQPLGGFNFAAAGRYFAPENFVQTDGSNVTLSGTLKTVAQNQTLRVNIDGADLAAVALGANPGAVLAETMIAFDVYPGSLSKGHLTSAPDLVAYSIGTGETPMLTVNQDFGDIFYGNPFPKNWTPFMAYQYNALTTYLAPGATYPTQLMSIVSGATTKLPSQTSPVHPMVGTVLNPLVGGNNLFADQSGIGLTPTLTWTAPDVGTADAYQVYVYELDNDSGNSVYGQVARFQTQSTSITFPPGILNSGLAYVFMIRAWHRPGIDAVRVGSDECIYGRAFGRDATVSRPKRGRKVWNQSLAPVSKVFED
jgi:hypothetical protein